MTVEILKYGEINIFQYQIIQDIINNTSLTSKITTRKKAEFFTKILFYNVAKPIFDKKLHYHVAIRSLDFLDKSTQLYIAHATHQCDRFLDNPKAPHDAVV